MFSYDVYFHDEEIGVIHEYGIVSALDYGSAANRLVEYFGRENVVSIEIAELMDVLSAEEIKEMF